MTNKNYEFMETDGLSYWRKRKIDWKEIAELAIITGLLIMAIYFSI